MSLSGKLKRMFGLVQSNEMSKQIDNAMLDLHEASADLTRTAVRSIMRDNQIANYDEYDKYGKDVGQVIARFREARKK